MPSHTAHLHYQMVEIGLIPNLPHHYGKRDHLMPTKHMNFSLPTRTTEPHLYLSYTSRKNHITTSVTYLTRTNLSSEVALFTLFHPHWIGLLRPHWIGLLRPHWIGLLHPHWIGLLRPHWIGLLHPHWIGLLSSHWIGLLHPHWIGLLSQKSMYVIKSVQNFDNQTRGL